MRNIELIPTIFDLKNYSHNLNTFIFHIIRTKTAKAPGWQHLLPSQRGKSNILVNGRRLLTTIPKMLLKPDEAYNVEIAMKPLKISGFILRISRTRKTPRQSH